ncbi:coiled-coil domain-containing protein [Actinomadura parmotrematis]|uniref:ARB-07466-like C-terminal domain-containing protein n=1 Tax=Actinomadura parmotrematis TaxID=2864039 RepID=A0ABS7FNW8_9ACTN|nr:hypothetical protein [Actinomadura parmotrematis]MBW8482072.1 hypothetical protein [Actinomadura parmotrematis]
MESPGSTGRPRAAARLRRAALALTALAATALPLTAGTLAPAPAAADPGDTSKLKKLNAQIARLDKEYGGDLAKLKDAQYGVRKALSNSGKLTRDLEQARLRVAQMAATQYMTGGADPSVQVLADGDPSAVLNSASLATHLSQNQATRVQQLQKLIDEQQKAKAQAQAKISDLQKEIADLDAQRTRIKSLVKKYKPQSPTSGMGGVTARMLKVKNVIDTEFGPFPIIGCVRSTGDPQDHGTGHACDFMESSGGTMPTAARVENGNQVAAYAIAHAGALGIKYIIWRQRIYDLRSPGWRAMEDRGGITANHYDHVHISVF